jgi:hypothetical protein
MFSLFLIIHPEQTSSPIHTHTHTHAYIRMFTRMLTLVCTFNIHAHINTPTHSHTHTHTHTHIHTRTGYAYDCGTGVDLDETRAFTLYHKAAVAGVSQAMYTAFFLLFLFFFLFFFSSCFVNHLFFECVTTIATRSSDDIVHLMSATRVLFFPSNSPFLLVVFYDRMVVVSMLACGS